MGTGFCCVVTATDQQRAEAVLRNHYGSARRIGEVTAEAGVVRLPAIGIAGREDGFEQA
jgi:phosphoribosylaminoimidazole (AIR) synthetase